jgi:predicted metal-binding protein
MSEELLSQVKKKLLEVCVFYENRIDDQNERQEVLMQRLDNELTQRAQELIAIIKAELHS